MVDPHSGPSIETYVETRLNLLTESVKEKDVRQTEALLSFIDATKAALAAEKAVLQAAQLASDLRYQQRFEAQSDALAAAFSSQQVAMTTAFNVAEKAVQAALASADRAVSKAEVAADKRFEALNELRQMLNDMMATLLTRIEAIQRFDAIGEKIEATNARVATIETRINVHLGEAGGAAQNKGDSKALIATAVAVAALLLSIVMAWWTFAK